MKTPKPNPSTQALKTFWRTSGAPNHIHTIREPLFRPLVAWHSVGLSPMALAGIAQLTPATVVRRLRRSPVNMSFCWDTSLPILSPNYCLAFKPESFSLTYHEEVLDYLAEYGKDPKDVDFYLRLGQFLRDFPDVPTAIAAQNFDPFGTSCEIDDDAWATVVQAYWLDTPKDQVPKGLHSWLT